VGPILFGAPFAFGTDFFEVLADVFQVAVRELFRFESFSFARVFQGMDDFVELEVNSGASRFCVF